MHTPSSKIKLRRAFAGSHKSAARYALLLSLLGVAAHAATENWTGATDGLWSLNTNWSGSTTPTSVDDLTILGPGNVAGALNINVDAASAANSINFTNTAATTLTNTTSGANQTLTIGSGGLTTGTGAVTIGSSTANQNINIALGASQTWSVGSGGLTATNVISGTGFGITKSGTGTLTLSGANTYSGGTTLNAGMILFGNSSAFGTGAITSNGGTIRYSGANVTTTNSLVVNGATTLDTAGGNWTLNGNISGSGAITRGTSATVTLFLGGDNSGYTGTFTSVNNGNSIVRFSNVNAGSANANWVFNNGTANRTTMSFGTGTISFGSMTGSGNVNGDTSGTKTISAGALGLNESFTGVINNGVGGSVIALTKVGTGTWTLSGNNAFTGGTTVSAGTLALGSATTLQSATGTITVNGGTLSSTVASTTLGGNLTLSGGSLLANGTSAGTIVLAANKNFSMTLGTFNYSLNDTVTGSGTGTFSITGGTFDLTNSITDYSLAYSVFTGFTSGTVSDLSFTNYDTVNWLASLGTNGQLTFTAVPEPSTYAAIAGALALGAVVLRRRRTSV